VLTNNLENLSIDGNDDSQENFQWENKPFAFFDIETTQIGDPESGKIDIEKQDIIEFAVVILDRFGLYERQTFQTLIYGEINEYSNRINNISVEMVQNAPKFEEVAGIIKMLLDDKIWVGHNISNFDVPILNIAFEKVGFEKPRCRKILDTVSIFKSCFKHKTKDLKLNTISNYFGCGETKHRSLDDVRTNIEVFKRVALSNLLDKNIFMESNIENEIDNEIPTQSDNEYIKDSFSVSMPKEYKFSQKLQIEEFTQQDNSQKQTTHQIIDNAIKNKKIVKLKYMKKVNFISPISWKDKEKGLFEVSFKGSKKNLYLLCVQN